MCFMAVLSAVDADTLACQQAVARAANVDALFARLDVVSKLNSQSGMAVLHTSKVNLFDMANPRTNSSDSFKRVRTS